MCTPEQTKQNYLNMMDFIENVQYISDTTKTDYQAKMRTMQDLFNFDGAQSDITEYLRTIENPNTRANKINVMNRYRQYKKLPTGLLFELGEITKSDISRYKTAPHPLH